MIFSVELDATDTLPANGETRPSGKSDSCSNNGSRWDSAARVQELGESHEFLVAFVNSKLPSDVRCQLGASDVIQSVLFSASQNAHTFRGTSEGEFQAWILEIARNRITDGIRRFRAYQYKIRAQNADCSAWDVVDDETPSRRFSAQEDALALIRAIESLPADMRQLVLLRYAKGFTFEQIGLEMKTPVTTCRRRWLSACKLLQQQLKYLVS